MLKLVNGLLEEFAHDLPQLAVGNACALVFEVSLELAKSAVFCLGEVSFDDGFDVVSDRWPGKP